MRAGAQQIKAIKGGSYGVSRESWQDDSWDVYDQIGEIKQGTNFIADVCAGVVLYIGIVPDADDQNPAPATGEVGAVEANDVLERIRVGCVEGGLEGFIREIVINLKVAGDLYILAEDEVPPNPDAITMEGRTGRPERWSVLSVSEVAVKRGYAEVIDRPKAKPRRVRLPGEDEEIGGEGDFVFLERIWQRHPRYGGLADCMMRALLLESDELLLLSRVIRGTARSRLAQAGIVEVPSEYSFASTSAEEGDETEDPETDKFMKRLGEAMLEAVEDESSPEGLVPIVVRAPSSAMQASGGIKHTAITTPAADKAADDRKDLLSRIGNSLDIPWEQVTGMGAANHWSAWQIDNASWGRYGQSTMRTLCQAVTAGILWPHLEAAGIAPELARQLIVWFDPANAIVDPDQGKTSDELFDRGSISWAAHRQRKGATEDEAPTPEELAMRSALGLLKGGNPSQAGGQGNTSPPEQDNSAAATASAALTAAAPARPLGRQLAEIDSRLRVSIAEIAEAAVTRALEKAGAQVRTASRKVPSMHASLTEVAAVDITSMCGPTAITAVGLTEDELVGNTVEGFASRFDTKIRKAQAEARKALRRRLRMDDAETDELEARQDSERRDAVAWLVTALTALTRERLFTPAGAPAQGEFDASARVPASIVREAMVRAGGGSLSGIDTPDGGVATGVDVMAIWAAHGVAVIGWEWDWAVGGDRRAFPGHEALDGVEFTSWDDPVLTVSADDSWLGRDFYRPGDHEGCGCSFVPLGSDDEPDQAAETAEAVA